MWGARLVQFPEERAPAGDYEGDELRVGRGEVAVRWYAAVGADGGGLAGVAGGELLGCVHPCQGLPGQFAGWLGRGRDRDRRGPATIKEASLNQWPERSIAAG